MFCATRNLLRQSLYKSLTYRCVSKQSGPTVAGLRAIFAVFSLLKITIRAILIGFESVLPPCGTCGMLL